MGKYDNLIKFLEMNLEDIKEMIGEKRDDFKQGFIEGIESTLCDIELFEKLEYYEVKEEAN